MRLAALFHAITPFLEGRCSHQEAVAALYPERPDSADAQRLAIYGAFCQGHRETSVDKVYLATREAIVERQGAEAWDALVRAYYQAHPMHSWELNENGRHLPEFLKGALPAELQWAAEVADVEWWEWQTLIAPDDPADAQRHEAPRLGATVELRSYGHDVLAYLDGGSAPPAAAPTLVLFWRDQQLEARRDRVSAEELWVLKQVNEGGELPTEGPLLEVLRDLQEAGIVR